MRPVRARVSRRTHGEDRSMGRPPSQNMTKRITTYRAAEGTHYANVDLDVYSRIPLDGFVQALGDEAFVLHVGGSGRKYEAHLELASSHMGMSADDTIVELTRLIRNLPPAHRKIWNSAQRREFNIGIEAGLRSEEHTSELQSLRHLVCRLMLEKEQ